MRIISGMAKGRRLHTLKGMSTRPTSDRVREAIFNIMGSSMENNKVLDLFAGFGAVGLEAISRGADSVTFVEKSKRVTEVIQRNLKELCFENAQIFAMDVFRFFRWMQKRDEKYDLIFADPPYAMYEEKWIGDLWPAVSSSLEEGGLFILEHPSKWTASIHLSHLKKIETRKFGQTGVSFYNRVPH